MEPSTRKRWASIWLRRLSTDRLKRPPSPDGLAVFARAGNALAIAAVDDAAARLGIAAGMALADARAQQPRLAIVEADEAADRALLERIADFCGRWSPAIVLQSRHSIALEIGGTAHLFGGEEALAEEIVQRIGASGLKVRIGLSDTADAAWAMAHFAARRCAPAGETCEALADLPVAALQLEEAAEALLMRLGLKTIGALTARPRAPFAARAGEDAMHRLDAVLGRAEPALAFRHTPPRIFALRRFLEPLSHADMLMTAARDAAEDAAAQLALRGLGARRLSLHLFGVSGRTRTISLGFSQAERSAKAMVRPFRERLEAESESADLEFGVEALRLDVVETGRFDGDAETSVARLVDTLSARLGAVQVRRLACADRHQPEEASASAPALNGALVQAPPPSQPRPLTLLAHPEAIEAIAPVPDGPPRQFRWRRVRHTIARAEGPERIAPDWLAAPQAMTRDYYVVEDQHGARFWLYREGLYGRETDAPRWWLHGLFS